MYPFLHLIRIQEFFQYFTIQVLLVIFAAVHTCDTLVVEFIRPFYIFLVSCFLFLRIFPYSITVAICFFTLNILATLLSLQLSPSSSCNSHHNTLLFPFIFTWDLPHNDLDMSGVHHPLVYLCSSDFNFIVV